MALDQEPAGLSRVHRYESKCILPLQDSVAEQSNGLGTALYKTLAVTRLGGGNLSFKPFPDLSTYACQIWLQSDGRVEKKGGYRQTHTQTDRQRDAAALYSKIPLPFFTKHEHLYQTFVQFKWV